MEDISREARVWYYRCTACGHVWNVPKDPPDGPIQDVTLRTPQNAKAN